VRVPHSWLRDFADFGDARSLVSVLDELGLVVEAVEEVGAGLSEVVVARVTEITPIRGADRIRRVLVDGGPGLTPPDGLQIVCGAWNFEEGELVPLAPVGTVLPNGMQIGRRTMRGITSEGMLCSGKELGLSDDGAGLLVLAGDATSFAPGTPILEALGIEQDTVFDIAVEANRPDALCIAGIARDAAAKLGLEFSIPDPPDPAQAFGGTGPVVGQPTEIAVEVPDPDLCPRFTARVVTGIRVAPSPAKIARRLVLAGMRPLNNVVDASNYVMLELGQPTHPYDLDRIAGATLRARAGVPGEKVLTLDGVERPVTAKSVGPGDDLRDCLICDGEDNPIGIGGVMGGASTEVTASTTRLALEAAYFNPMSIARTSMRFGLRTEASVRFERGCDPMGIERAVSRFCEVLSETAGPDLLVSGGWVDVSQGAPGPSTVTVRTERLNRVLGSDLDADQIARYLAPIGFATTASRTGLLEVEVPTFRPDVAREIDVVEEVARHHGYQSFRRTLRRPSQVGGIDHRQRMRRTIRAAFTHTGAHESWTASLIAPGDHEKMGLDAAGIHLSNPLTPDESVLRRSMMPGLARAVAFNQNRRQTNLRLFEIGNVFPVPDEQRIAKAMEHKDPSLSVVDERELVSLVLAGPLDDARSAAAAWNAIADQMGVTDVGMSAGREHRSGSDWTWGSGLHPTRSAVLVVTSGANKDAAIGDLGEIDPEVLSAFGVDATRGRTGWLTVDLGLLLDVAPHRSDQMQAVSRYPSTDFDLAFLVPDDVPADRVERTLRSAGGALLERVWLFDVFRGPDLPVGERSLAYRLRFCAPDRTLTDVEVAELRSACIKEVESVHGAKIRS